MSSTNVTEQDAKTQLGFWIYLMTDCLLFASLFATYIVLKPNHPGSPSAAELFDLRFVLIETILLLTSTLTTGLMMLALRQGNHRAVITWLCVTFLLGAAFLGMEITEFTKFVYEGYAWHTNAFLSAFFTLVGTHGVHILIGLIWILVMLRRIKTRSLSPAERRRLSLFGMFWHFLDVIWIFIFTIVYLMGDL